MLRLPAFVGHAVALLEVAAGAERLCAAAGDDHRAQPLQIDRERLEHLHEIETHARIQRVGHLGSIERDKQDVIAVSRHGNCLKIGPHPNLLIPTKPASSAGIR